MNTQRILDTLHRKALWVIMDPWASSPISSDYIAYPLLDQHNAVIMARIQQYLVNVTYVAVSCPIEVNGVDAHVALPFRHYPNTYNNLDNLVAIMTERNLKDVVYCGFHYGHCILNKPDGAVYTSKRFTPNRVWVKRDLCCVLPGDDLVSHDRITSQYAGIL